MPKTRDISTPPFIPIIFTKWREGFSEVDFTLTLEGAFDLTTHLQALQAEGGAKGCGVVLNASLVPLDELYGPDQPTESEEQENERQENSGK